MSVVVDSSAIMAILKREEDARQIAERLSNAEAKFVSAATYMECGTVVVGRYGSEGLLVMKDFVQALKLEIVPLTSDQANLGIEAFSCYGRGSGHPAKLNFGDCFSYALAKTRNLPLLFKGDDFIHTDIEPALKPA
jgi:ribonuclease VapC